MLENFFLPLPPWTNFEHECSMLLQKKDLTFTLGISIFDLWISYPKKWRVSMKTPAERMDSFYSLFHGKLGGVI